MNILPFVFAILLILAYGATASLQTRAASRRNQKAHIGLCKAELSLLRQSEMERYKGLPGTPVKTERKAAESSDEPGEPSTQTVNPLCARLNLFPLIDKGKEECPALYETAAQLLRLFYSPEEKGAEYRILNAVLTAAKRQLREEFSIPIETLDLKDPVLQSTYYSLLKGTRKCQLGEKGFPPLVDYFKIERHDTTICLFDAHPHMLTVFFGPKTAPKLYEELHQGQKNSMELDAIIQMANDPHLAFVDPAVWALLNFHRPQHGNGARQILVAEDSETNILLRKSIKI